MLWELQNISHTFYHSPSCGPFLYAEISSAYLSAVSILLEDTLAAVGHRVYFRSLYSTQKHAIRTSLLLFFPRRRSSVEPSPIRMNISPGMRVAARRHKSFLRATTVALFCRTRPGGRAKKYHSACIRHHRCRERYYTGREYCNPRVTSGKTGRDSSLLRDIPRTSPSKLTHTRSKSCTLCPRNFVINFCRSKQALEYLSIPRRFTCHNCNTATRNWLCLSWLSLF